MARVETQDHIRSTQEVVLTLNQRSNSLPDAYKQKINALYPPAFYSYMLTKHAQTVIRHTGPVAKMATPRTIATSPRQTSLKAASDPVKRLGRNRKGVSSPSSVPRERELLLWPPGFWRFPQRWKRPRRHWPIGADPRRYVPPRGRGFRLQQPVTVPSLPSEGPVLQCIRTYIVVAS
ncbi:uncharacterized protein LY79DRAFT_559553 [Colletotrichum navitas]|uniref:Uncharacterized protein n=1 Tax=Colletotrichum navitas TaxID=681940 RepID=A0AAD8V2Q3_9PEZI|nr:uncharacterized protein LY79DRAFT_559553 [Colletotrichum navitas]KAK1585023.1 hypothetical protein LY79DRAFT_559553 [Colletotrichum navitas]